jgi:predicted NUDIX family phosphoesterase
MSAQKRHAEVLSAPDARNSTLLQAAEAVLRQAHRSLHSREIAQAIIEAGLSQLTGKTPWKTVTARLSMDILDRGSASHFMRTSYGLFALREWDFATEFEVKRRRIAPIDETIRVVPRDKVEALKQEASLSSPLYSIGYEALISASIEMPRREAEETDECVQLIPTFVVRRGDKIWTYTRTKRLPEARLHHTRCVSFGGHMQAEDELYLFRDEKAYEGSVLRELYEELAFTKDPTVRYLGAIHLTSNLFERQHLGLVFEVTVGTRAQVASLEPGMHTDVRPTPLAELRALAPSLDSWSQLLIRVIDGTG